MTFYFDDRKDFTNSSVLKSAFYDKATGECVVEFLNGSLRRYSGVNATFWRNFKGSDSYGQSAGSWYNYNLKDKTAYPSAAFSDTVVRRGFTPVSVSGSQGTHLHFGVTEHGVVPTPAKRNYEVSFEVDVPDYESVEAANDVEAVKLVREKYPNLKLTITNVEGDDNWA